MPFETTEKRGSVCVSCAAGGPNFVLLFRAPATMPDDPILAFVLALDEGDRESFGGRRNGNMCEVGDDIVGRVCR